MPTLVLLARPNGAGKTTLINHFLRQRTETFQFVNPDEVALGLPVAGGQLGILRRWRRWLAERDG